MEHPQNLEALTSKASPAAFSLWPLLPDLAVTTISTEPDSFVTDALKQRQLRVRNLFREEGSAGSRGDA
jgi:hypothetical protein